MRNYYLYIRRSRNDDLLFINSHKQPSLLHKKFCNEGVFALLASDDNDSEVHGVEGKYQDPVCVTNGTVFFFFF